GSLSQAEGKGRVGVVRRTSGSRIASWTTMLQVPLRQPPHRLGGVHKVSDPRSETHIEYIIDPMNGKVEGEDMEVEMNVPALEIGPSTSRAEPPMHSYT
ncbi:unnamed protein product, partial [Ilex paraguariensis]